MALPLSVSPSPLEYCVVSRLNQHPAGVQRSDATAASSSGNNNISTSSTQAGGGCATSASSNVGVGSIRNATAAASGSNSSNGGGHSPGSHTGDREHTSSIRGRDGTTNDVRDNITRSPCDGHGEGIRPANDASADGGGSDRGVGGDSSGGEIDVIGIHSSVGGSGGGSAVGGEGGDCGGGMESGGVRIFCGDRGRNKKGAAEGDPERVLLQVNWGLGRGGGRTHSLLASVI